MSAFISTVVGGLVSIGVVILVEYLRRPRLKLTILPPDDGPWPNLPPPVQQMRSLRLKLSNEPLSWWANWMVRAPALQCRAAITFYDQQGQHDIFGRTMEGRWARSPEPFVLPPLPPLPPPLEMDDLPSADSQGLPIIPEWSCNVYPGESETLDLIVRTDVSPNSYGWNNETYFSNPVGRNLQWQLPPGINRIEVVITSSGQKRTSWFTLMNAAGLQAFHLE